MIKIKVPATSANLGSGFDTLGIALSLYATFSFEPAKELSITGCEKQYANSSNLVYQSMCDIYEKAHMTMNPVHIHIESEIPLARGLGSSASCIVAGMLAANIFLNEPFTIEEIFTFATQKEGHPDNIAPCLFGGLQACKIHKDTIYHLSFPVHTDLTFYAAIPDFELSTKQSRSVLPKHLSYPAVTNNLSSIAFLLKGLETGDETLLNLGFQDQLHQPYRFPLIPDSESFINASFYPNYLSGAGPTLMFVSKNNRPLQLQPRFANWKMIPLEVDHTGAIILERSI